MRKVNRRDFLKLIGSASASLALQQIFPASSQQLKFAGKFRADVFVDTQHPVDENDIVSYSGVDSCFMRCLDLQKLDVVVPGTHAEHKVVRKGKVSAWQFNPEEVMTTPHDDYDIIGYSIGNEQVTLTVDRRTCTSVYAILRNDDIVILVIAAQDQVATFHAHLDIPTG